MVGFGEEHFGSVLGLVLGALLHDENDPKN